MKDTSAIEADRRAKMRQNQSALVEQIEHHKRKEESLLVQKREFANQVNQNTRIYEDELRQERLQRAEKLRAHQKDIRGQIESRSELLK